MVFGTAGFVRAQNDRPEIVRRDGKTLVSIPVTVSDREGRYVSGLKKTDFTLFQNGVKQEIDFFATFDEPLNIALLLDTSGSTTDSLASIKDAAADFIRLLNPQDKCLIATFDARVKILSPLTDSRESLAAALGNVSTAEQDGTLLREAVWQIAQNAFKNTDGRKVVIILSDGKDIGSNVTQDALRGQLEESDVLIYSIYYKTGVGASGIVVSSDGTIKAAPEPKPQKKAKAKKTKGYAVFIPEPVNTPSVEEIEARERRADVEGVQFLKEMSDKTAGRFQTSDAGDLTNTFKAIAAELRQQYRLGFEAKAAPDKLEASEITVKVSRPDAVVRARGSFRAKKL